MPRKLKLILLTALIGLSLAGCMTVPLASYQMDQQVKMMRPPKGKALVFILGPHNAAKYYPMPVYCADRYLGKVTGGTYIYTTVKPAIYVFKYVVRDAYYQEVQADKGDIIYLEEQITMRPFQSPLYQLVQLSEDQGQRRLSRSQLSLDCTALNAAAQ